MTRQISFTAIGLVFALAALGFATLDFLPALKLQRAVFHVQPAEPAGPRQPQIYCHNGMNAQYSKLHQSFVCSTNPEP